MSAEDVIAMLLSVLIAGVIAALALTFWPPRRGGPSSGPSTGPGPVSAVLLPMSIVDVLAESSVSRADSTEGLLIVRLLRGELTSEQYHEAMAAVAAREETRNPMRLPGEIGPATD
ncbi:hypothetical protein [Actinoplanes sp. L3-i22]|uniref:hypothetical protein n=1 Tax=Actinoplanes sp. L3-i22 TaxID=2836373 RepID=UPI001C754C3C|nr:hypothetical protein [Actinoplanes sp. L3-i22]BCY07915.1 hypothetical protein L3i22_030030 [Actinoplanes sp. L3-i22]